MKTKETSWKVQYLIDALAEMSYEEVREFRKLMFEVHGKDLGLDHISSTKTDDDGDSPAGACVPRLPKVPNLTGSVRLG